MGRNVCSIDSEMLHDMPSSYNKFLIPDSSLAVTDTAGEETSVDYIGGSKLSIFVVWWKVI